MHRTGPILAACLLIAMAGGCKKRTPAEEAGVQPGGGLTEDSMTASSLDRASRGLTPGENGVLQDVHFAFDRSDLDAEALEILRGHVEWLEHNPRAKVEIEGHCDSRGTVEYNLALGSRRAHAILEHLVAHGVVAERLTAISFGEELPLCREETETCWARNRRGHFAVTP